MRILQCAWVCLVGSVIVAFCAENAAAHGARRGCCPPPPPPEPILLHVCHPCTGCKYEVQVCVPACCVQEAPRVCFQNTLIGNGKTVFSWSNGHTVTIRYPASGGYRVIQRG
jgi:hypothetical protein